MFLRSVAKKCYMMRFLMFHCKLTSTRRRRFDWEKVGFMEFEVHSRKFHPALQIDNDNGRQEKWLVRSPAYHCHPNHHPLYQHATFERPPLPTHIDTSCHSLTTPFSLGCVSCYHHFDCSKIRLLLHTLKICIKDRFLNPLFRNIHATTMMSLLDSSQSILPVHLR